MNRWPVRLAMAAFAVLIVSLWVWHLPWLGPLLSLPLLACLAGMIRGNSRAFVVAGALALPYICYAMLEIVVARGERPAAAVALLAASVVFIAVLLPALRHLRRGTHAGTN